MDNKILISTLKIIYCEIARDDYETAAGEEDLINLIEELEQEIR